MGSLQGVPEGFREGRVVFGEDDYTDDELRLQKLEAFYRAVAELTVNHDVIGDSAVVFPSKLGKELEKVDPEWYNNA
jgi:hypothetical protein